MNGNSGTIDSINSGVSFSKYLYNKGFYVRCTTMNGIAQHHSTVANHESRMKVRMSYSGKILADQTVFSTSTMDEPLTISVSNGTSFAITTTNTAQFADALFLECSKPSSCTANWNITGSATVIIE